MYEGIYLVFIHLLCIFVDILTVYYTSFIFFNIKYQYNITLIKRFNNCKWKLPSYLILYIFNKFHYSFAFIILRFSHEECKSKQLEKTTTNKQSCIYVLLKVTQLKNENDKIKEIVKIKVFSFYNILFFLG